jgi:hypothetical protein
MTRQKTFAYRPTRTRARVPQGLPLTAPQLDRLLGRLDQYTSTQLGEKAGVNGSTILHAAHGDPITHESARHILNLLDRLDAEEADARRKLKRNLEVSAKLLEHEPSEESLAHLQVMAAESAAYVAKANAEAYREAVRALQDQLDRLRQ